MNYYNEFEPFAAAWLRNLIAAGLIPAGEVDERSVRDVRTPDLVGFRQCHFFAGIGGWPLALRLAGVADDAEVWTGSCPCQPFSVAGKGAAQADKRHLWPEFARLVGECKPPIVFGEQVNAAIGHGWLDGVCADLEALGYACGAAVLPACAVGAPHRRERLWWVAVGDANVAGCGAREPVAIGGPARPEHPAQSGPCPGQRLADAQGQRPGRGPDDEDRGRRQFASADRGAGSLGDAVQPSNAGGNLADASGEGLSPSERHALFGAGRWQEGRNAFEPGRAWRDAQWLAGADGKARRVKPGVRLLADGVPNRVGRLRGYGNAIVPQVAAEFITASLEAIDCARLFL